MGQYYEEEDEEKMIKDMERDIKKGMKIYSYYPVKGGYIYHSGPYCIHQWGGIRKYLENKNDDKKEITI